jgi:hypothetical protein
MMHAETNYILTDTPSNRGGRLRLLIVALVAVALAAAAFAVSRDAAATGSAGFGAPPAEHPAHLSDTPAPDTAQVPLATTSSWEFRAQGQGGKVCDIVAINGHGSTSACANPQETEALGLSETLLASQSVHLITGVTVAKAKTIVLELADGSTTELSALGHPTLGGYKFFVTEFRPDITGVVAVGANGQEVARASYQSMRFLTER